MLDAGCGNGALLLAAPIAGRAGSRVELDVEPEMICQACYHAARARSPALFEVVSIAEMFFTAASFDVVLNTLMMHHMAPDVARLLKPGGRFLVVDISCSRSSFLTAPPGHAHLDQRDHVRDEVTRMVADAGIEGVAGSAHPSRQLSYAPGPKAAIDDIGARAVSQPPPGVFRQERDGQARPSTDFGVSIAVGDLREEDPVCLA